MHLSLIITLSRMTELADHELLHCITGHSKYTRFHHHSITCQSSPTIFTQKLIVAALQSNHL